MLDSLGSLTLPLGLSPLSFAVILVLGAFALSRSLAVFKGWRTVGHIPGVLTTHSPLSLPGILLALLPVGNPRIPGLNVGWLNRHRLYKGKPSKTFSMIPTLSGEPLVYTAHPDALEQIMNLGVGGAFRRRQETADPLSIFGPHVVTAIGEDWRRHRRITAPAFSLLNYRVVWDTVARVYKEFLEKENAVKAPSLNLEDISKVTHKVALFLISICGFGIPMSWDDPYRDSEGRLSIQEVILTVSTTMVQRQYFPRYMYNLGLAFTKKIDEAWNTFVTSMFHHIDRRTIELTKMQDEPGHKDKDDTIRDVFGRLVNARLTEGKHALSEQEILANCFAFMFAGHETTANTLSAALAMLAVNQDKQDWLYNSIMKTVGDREPTYDDYEQLEDVLSTFYEALRLYPAAYMMLRIADRDTQLSLPRFDKPDQVDVCPIKKGTTVVFDMLGYTRSPELFPDPETFDPERWTRGRTRKSPASDRPLNKDESLLFSQGPRICLGKKFAQVEAVAFLTLLLRDWRVEPIFLPGETVPQWQKRVLKPFMILTLHFQDKVPLRLVRRKAAA